jgi:hypothetical protein
MSQQQIGLELLHAGHLRAPQQHARRSSQAEAEAQLVVTYVRVHDTADHMHIVSFLESLDSDCTSFMSPAAFQTSPPLQSGCNLVI